MPGITLEQAQANLDALVMATSLSVRLSNGAGDRYVVTYASQKERNEAILFWERKIAALEGVGSGLGYSLADFRNPRT